MSDASLSRLSHDVVQNTYKELHALLDSLGEASPEEKRTRLLDSVLNLRHRIARLLVIVRWFMSYSAFHGSAQGTRDLANAHSSLYTADSDTLYWKINDARAAESAPCAIPEAAEILGTSCFNRLPSIIERSIGIDIRSLDAKPITSGPSVKEPEILTATGEDDISVEALDRLRLQTRRTINDCLPRGVRAIDFNVAPDNVPVRIGVPGVWTTDVVLSSLKHEETFMRLLRLKIYIDGHPDAPTQIRSRRRAKERPLPLRRIQLSPLQEMLDDRMRWAVLDVPLDASHVDKMKQALRALCTAMSLECCGSLIMSHIREQAGAMMVMRTWRDGELVVTGRWTERGKKKGPVRLEYWRRSHLRASVSLDVCRIKDGVIESNVLERIVDIQHEPPLPGRDMQVPFFISSVNLQQFLIDCGCVRARCELEKISELINSEFSSKVRASVVHYSNACIGVATSFRGGGIGLTFEMSLITGALSLRPRGSVELALGRNDELGKELASLLWKGDKFFSSSKDVWTKVKRIIGECQEVVWRQAMTQSVWAGGGGAMTSWPPGRFSIDRSSDSARGKAIRPPLAVVERKRPRVFMTLETFGTVETDKSDWLDNLASKRARIQSGQGLKYFKHGDLTFVESQLRNGMVSPADSVGQSISASSMAAWAELRHDVRMRLLRGRLLGMLQEFGVISSWRGDAEGSMVHEAIIQLRTSPMDVKKAVVKIRDTEDWVLELTLSKDTFADGGLHGSGASYCKQTRVLQFWYSEISIASAKGCLREVMRARAAATLALELVDMNDKYNLMERSHRYVLVESSGLHMMIGLGIATIEVEIWPEYDLLRTELIPYVEELLSESRKQMGTCLATILEVTVPMAMALLRATSEEQAKYRIKFATVLRARLAFFARRKNGESVTFGLDMDARSLNGMIVLSDLGKVRQLRAEGTPDRIGGAEMTPIPTWDKVLSKSTSKKMAVAVNQNTGLEMNADYLGRVVNAIIKSVILS